MIISQISKLPIRDGEAVSVREIRDSIFQLIVSEHPDLEKDHYISIDELNGYRRRYLSNLILQEKGELAQIDQDVMQAIRNNSILTENIRRRKLPKLTKGQRWSDAVASFGGSWKFIIIFFMFIAGWMLVNIWFLVNRPFDPYPFILLNLILSCLAAIQAPIIMMSQNRQDQKDRQRAEHDYKINLKAELEIQLLNEKMDHLLIHQNKKLLEIQELQTDYLEDLLRTIKKNNMD